MSVQVQQALPFRETSRHMARDKMAARRRKRQSSDSTAQKNLLASGLYVHSSPPRVLQMNPSVIRQWLRSGDVDRLEQVVLEGQGHKLVGEYSPDPKARAFLKTVPQYMAKIEMLHDAVSRGQDEDVKSMLAEDPRRRLVLCKGQAGVGLLHKAIHFEHLDLARWLIDNHPAIVAAKDREGRTALHYCAASKQPSTLWERLVAAGADDSVVDTKGQPATFYIDHPGQISLPEPKKAMGAMRRYTDGKDGLVVSRANIRICIHDRDLGRLQQMLWEGHGGKLRVETSNNPRVKRFLDAVPYIMGTIKDVHSAAVNGDVEMFKKRTAEPVPEQIMLSRDDNGMQPLHKAAGLGHSEIVDAILERTPAAINGQDNEGKTPLHYAATAKEPHMFEYLLERGADEAAIDHKGKTAGQYRLRPSEVDATRLRVIPEAPRTATMFPPAWDWRLLNNMTYDFGPINGNHASGASDREKPTKKVAALRAAPVRVPTPRPRPLSPQEDEEDKGDNGEEEGEEVEPQEESPRREAADILYLDVPRSELDDKLRPASSEVDQEEDEGVDSADERHEDELRRAVVEEEDPPPYQDQDEYQEQEQEREQEQDQERDEELERPAMKFNEDVLEEMGGEGDDGETARTPEPDVDEGVGSEPEGGAREQPGDAVEFHNTVTGDQDVDNDVENPGNVVGVKEADEEVARLVRAGDMEALAAMVLDGKGRLLLGHDSDDPELHAFLTNVPAYTAKIRAVHKAAREGQLRDLQASLDRRKFAVARDEATPLGATPLHVATLFGNTGVVRYLATRFPETLNAKDQDGRTPLHYAAAIADNGHYFNMLVNLGANPMLKDSSGRTAEYYLRNQDRMTHKSLLQQFGSRQDAADSLQDKGPTVAGGTQVEMPVLWTEEGRYLADALGEPLIKGLTEVANKRPENPVMYLATYLYNFGNHVDSPRTSALAELRPAAITGSPLSDRDPEDEDVDVENDDVPTTPLTPDMALSSANRDEHGQSMLHFAAARAHGRSALFQLLEETELNVAYRDELYRTARDVAIQANLPDNILDIDRWVLYLAARGETEKLAELTLEGYDHILDVEDDEDNHIVDVVASREHHDTVAFLQSIPIYEERREQVHAAVRAGHEMAVRDMLRPEQQVSPGLLVAGKNGFGRAALHVAVLCQHTAIAEFIAQNFRETLRIGDNLERTPLHYAMALDKVEDMSTILIQAGAKRVLKDLKGRQPSYYFMNKSDILRLQQEEQALL